MGPYRDPLDKCVTLIFVCDYSHTQNLSAIHPAVCEIWKTGAHVRTCRFTPPLTCVKVIASWSLSTHQIWTQSGQPSWSYRWRGCLWHPLQGTCHVPWQAPAGIGTGQIHDWLDGDIVLKWPFVSWSSGSREISVQRAWPRPAGRPAGRSYWLFSHI